MKTQVASASGRSTPSSKSEQTDRDYPFSHFKEKMTLEKEKLRLSCDLELLKTEREYLMDRIEILKTREEILVFKDTVSQNDIKNLKAKIAPLEHNISDLEQKIGKIAEMEHTVKDSNREIEKLLKRNRHLEEKYSRQSDLFFKTRICRKFQSFDSYILYKVINGGAHGCVTDCGLRSDNPIHQNLRFAIKMMFNYGINTTNLRDSFNNEFQILEHLPYHDNIIQIFTSFVDKPSRQDIETISKALGKESVKDLFFHTNNSVRSTLFIVMEKIEPNLQEFIIKNPITVEKGLNLCKQIADGLVFLWENNVVHRDIKLDNILVLTQLEDHHIPVICDFGLAKVVDKEGKCKVSDIGNTIHTAPDIAKRVTGFEIITDFSKQPPWELGVICYEICSEGSFPFDPYDPRKALSDIDFSLMRKKGYPQELEDLISDLLQQHPSDRISIKEAQQRLTKM